MVPLFVFPGIVVKSRLWTVLTFILPAKGWRIDRSFNESLWARVTRRKYSIQKPVYWGEKFKKNLFTIENVDLVHETSSRRVSWIILNLFFGKRSSSPLDVFSKNRKSYSYYRAFMQIIIITATSLSSTTPLLEGSAIKWSLRVDLCHSPAIFLWLFIR